MSAKPNQAVVQALSELLASSYTLYLKTQNFHWNVTGPMFSTLHDLFEAHYTEYAAAIDEIAERIRALGDFSPGSYADFTRLSAVKDETGHPAAKEMIRILAEDNATVAAAASKLIEAGEAAGDEVSLDIGVRRIETHEKNAWMLNSHLE